MIQDLIDLSGIIIETMLGLQKMIYIGQDQYNMDVANANLDAMIAARKILIELSNKISEDENI